MIRILHVIHGLQRGGLENGVVNIVNRLPQNDFVQAICCLEHVGEMAERLGQDVEIFEVNRGSYDFRAPLRLAAVIRKWQPDIIHCRNWNTWLDTVMAKLISASRAKLVWSFHGFADGEVFPGRRKVASQVLSRFTDRLFAVCMDSAERYSSASGIALGRFDVLYNGVDTGAFEAAPVKETARECLGLPQDALIATTVASLSPVKNHEGLLDAINFAVPELPEKVLFLWLGEGALRDQLMDQIEKTAYGKSIKLLGNVDNVHDYLAASDIFILPSRLEGMSNAILEAMSASLPVVAHDVGGNKELVKDKETGFLSPYEEPRSMADHIVQLMQDTELRKRQAKKARQRAVDQFSMDSMVHRYAEYYRGMVL